MRSMQERVNRIVGIRNAIAASLPTDDGVTEEALATYTLAYLTEEVGEELEKAVASVDISR